MTVRSVFCLLTLFIGTAGAQTLKSPETFLGYAQGARFTPHARIVDYFKYAAEARPDMMKLENYGLTYEGRPLMLAVVSSAANIGRLEAIRRNNLALAGMKEEGKADPDMPVIVWLSYNVHGNEASSSEVSMKVLYKLLSSSSPEMNSRLANTVIIIDPCLNPDGRDRYVNWYNSTAGKLPNPDPAAAEHDEPWPTGRGNHYYFDLNRDWAWQTQDESRFRIKKYGEWMPAVHVDFHEQYPGSPYYFAPAAEPFHEVISPWQRHFQEVIGKNHAKYFDERGWLYFTREYFDLFYPAYGDTYPIYNGSIGMTYEQAGHGIAGLAIKTQEDTLTLEDRILHHYTTSMSTIESASLHAAELNREFAKYFAGGISEGYGAFGSYLISGRSSKKIEPLLKLFDANGIRWSGAQTKKGLKGFSYCSGKEELVDIHPDDILVSSRQPKSALVKVLFEPRSLLADSSTYDITAWSLPYAYGIQAWAMKESIPAAAAAVSGGPAFDWQSPYGYLMAYDAFSDAVLVASLLREGVKLRYAEKSFTYAGKKFLPGTVIILKKGNENKLDLIENLFSKNKAMLTPVSSGFMDSGIDFGSDKVHLLKKIRVAAVTGKMANAYSAGEVWHLFEQQLGYPLTMINMSDPSSADLRDYDVLIIPDGDYAFLSDKEGASTLRNWVKQGGKLIVMERAASALAAGEWGLKKKKEEDGEKEQDHAEYENLRKYGNRDRDGIVNNIPGAIYRVELDNTHPLAFGYPDFYFSLKQNSDLYEFSKEGWNVGVIKKEQQVSGFVGSKVKGRMQDGAVMGVLSLGAGEIIYFADDPLFRSFWENGKLMFANAVFLVGE